MRSLPLVLTVGCVACGILGPSGGPPASIAGTWSSWPPGYCCNPAGPETMILAQSGSTVSGTDSWAARHDTVTGQYESPNVRLELSPNGSPYVFGATNDFVYTGTAPHPTRMILNGTTFYKQ